MFGEFSQNNAPNQTGFPRPYFPVFWGAPPNSGNILPAWVHPHKEQTNSTRIIAFIEILEVYMLDLPTTTGCNRHHEAYEISSVGNPNLNLQLNHSLLWRGDPTHGP